MPPLVLVVDDEDALRRAQSKYLRRHGYEVREAATGPDGLAAALEPPIPDAIIMDIMLPGMDGVHVTTELRKYPLGAHIPVIASTGAVLRDLPVGDAGFAQILFKPYDLQMLLSAVESAIGSTVNKAGTGD